MAVVTLKDLMDPLTKLVAATEKNTQKLDAVIAAVTGGSGTSLNQEIIKELQAQTNLLKVIAGNTAAKSTKNSTEAQGSDQKLAKDTALSLQAIGVGAQSLAVGLILFKLVPKKAIESFLNTVKQIFTIFGESSTDSAKFKETAESFNLIAINIASFSKSLALSSVLLIPGIIGAKLFSMSLKMILSSFTSIENSSTLKENVAMFKIISENLYEFSKSLALSSILLIPGIIGAKLFSITIKMLLPTFIKLGEAGESIKSGADAIGMIGKSLSSFAKGLIIAAIGSVIGIVFAPAIVAVLLLIGVTYALLGKMGNSIEKGANSINTIGKGLVFLALGIVTFAIATMFILLKPTIIFSMVGIILLIGGAFAILGTMGPLIQRGVKSLNKMGLTLALFSVGVLSLALVSMFIMTNPMVLLTMAGTIILIGGAFALLGLVSPFINAGAGAILLVGVGLIALAAGLYFLSLAVKSSMTLFEPSEIDSQKTNIEVIVGGILNAFIINPIKALAIFVSAPALVLASLALILMSLGLFLFGKAYATKDVKELFKDSGETSMFGSKMSNLEKVLNDVALGFLLNPAKIASMYLSFPAFIGASVSLMLMSLGLFLFGKAYATQDVKELFKNSGETSMFGSKMSNLEKVLNDVALSFTLNPAKIASMYLSFPAFIGASVALMTMSGGISLFASVYKSVKNSGLFDRSENPDAITTGFMGIGGGRRMSNLEYLLDVVALSFTLSPKKIASMYASFPAFIGAGMALITVAKGLKSFAGVLEQKDLDELIGIGNKPGKIEEVLTAVMASFKKIADDNGITGSGGVKAFLFGGNNPISGGIEMVRGVGKALNDIASGVKAFGNLKKMEIDLPTIGANIAAVITEVGGAFATIGGDSNKKEGIFWDDDLIQIGIKRVKGAGKELKDIATGLKTFASLENPTAVANSIKTIFTSIGDTFTFYYEKPKFKSQLDHMKGFITEISNNAKNGYIDKAANGMSKIATAVNSIDSVKAEAFANLFKGAGDLTNNQRAFEALLEAVEEIRDALAGGTAPAAPTAPAAAAAPAAGGGQPAGELGPTLARISSTLSSLNSTMTGLPSAISLIKLKIQDS